MGENGNCETMTIKCKKCGKRAPAKAEACPNCGNPISAESRAEAEQLPYHMVAFGCLSMVLLVFAIQGVVLVIKVVLALLR